MTQAQLKNKTIKLPVDAQTVKKVKKDKKKRASARLSNLLTNINKAFENDYNITLHTTASVLRDHLTYIFKQEYPKDSLI